LASRAYYLYEKWYEMSIDDFHDDPALDRVERLLRAAGPPPEPSADLRARLLEIPRLEARGTQPATRAGFGRFWTSLTAWRLASGALALAAVVLAVVAVTRDSGQNAVNGQRIALTASSEYRNVGATGDAVSLVTHGTRHIRVRIDGLPATKGSQVYELWIAKDKKHRVSIGIFRPDANGNIDATVAIPNLGPNWRGIWLTHEQGTGKPGWSRDWVVAGRLA
jgi:anti-sigma-K factor RskA